VIAQSAQKKSHVDKKEERDVHVLSCVHSVVQVRYLRLAHSELRSSAIGGLATTSTSAYTPPYRYKAV